MPTIDWSRLYTYNGDQESGFEELCCQIFRAELGHLGTYKRIGLPGTAQRGVEAIIVDHNGNEIGLQAKWFYPGGLSQGGRKTQIKKSLIDAKERTKLTKLIVSLPIILNEGEKTGWKWWSQLNEKLDLPYDLEDPWDKDKLHSLLSSIKHIGRRHYWFGDLELYPEWFEKQVSTQIRNVGNKYLRGLHVEGHSDRRIHLLLGDNIFVNQLTKNKKELKETVIQSTDLPNRIVDNREYSTLLESNLNDVTSAWSKYLTKTIEFLTKVDQFNYFVSSGFFDDAHKLLSTTKLSDIIDDEAKLIFSTVSDSKYHIIQSNKDKKGNLPSPYNTFISALETLEDRIYTLQAMVERLLSLVNCFHAQKLIIAARPGIGKTHLVCHASENIIENKKPAILLLGSHFTTNDNLKVQIRDQLGISNQYNWDQIIGSLECAAETHRSRILIVIDALNETPTGVQQWKNQLAGIIHDLNRSSWLCVVVTSRDSYLKAIFGSRNPQNLSYLQDNESISKYKARYFQYYNIKLKHVGPNLAKGLKNRFFVSLLCKTYGTPNQQREKVINVQDITLADIFENYIQKADDAICNKLNTPTGCHSTRSKLIALAKRLWATNQINLPKLEAIQIIDNEDPAKVKTDDSWTYGIIHEGLLIDFNWTDDHEVMEFSHQSFGEYLMAINLIEGKNKEELIKILKKPSKHPRLLDVMEWIALLLPQITNKHLFEIIKPSNLMAQALEVSLFEIPLKNINRQAMNWMARRFTTSTVDSKQAIINRISNSAYIPKYPFNSLFLEQLLKKLPMSDRDIIWSEWIRGYSSEISKRIRYFESVCKNEEVSIERKKKLVLEAKFFQWFLTSSNRGIRDRSTRALYWFGRIFPEEIYKLTEESLNINDPYVSERMLATSYGVAMALQYDSTFNQNILSEYAKKLYKLIFKKEAPYSTTHILMRDYARLTIKIALLHNPKLLNLTEKKRITPPFKDGGIRKWSRDQECKKELTKDSRATWGYGPISMDFAKYIIGGISCKGSYYLENRPTIKESLSKIMWRIKKLGYSENKFKDIDSIIQRSTPYDRFETEATGRTERYGKKYAWIAYHELAGLFADKYPDKESWIYNYGRSSDVDIDPSFPDEIQKVEVIKNDYLGKRSSNLPKWITRGPTPNLSPYLIIDELQGQQGPWVLLDGYITQEDLKAKRDIFIFPRGMFVKKRNHRSVVNRLENQDLGGRWVPEIPQLYYTFSGEVPLCETYPHNGETDLVFTLSRKILKVPVEKDFDNIDLSAILTVLDKMKNKKSLETELSEPVKSGKLNRKTVAKYREEVIEKTKEYKILIPITTLSWESHHSAVNPRLSAYVICREICEALDLSYKPQTFDLYDSSGTRASITLKWGDEHHSMHKLIYIRQDLLVKFMKVNKMELIWAIWGERRFQSKPFHEVEKFAKKHEPYKVFQKVVTYKDIV